ncbi:hypothetical protein KW805_04015 [Candidatus Pacearchaeota archaeon]|nr:hypothetical protein [Candidatus Pacearchaeota archaeon]
MTKWENVWIIAASVLALLFLIAGSKRDNLTIIYDTISVVAVALVIYVLARFSK